MLLIKRSTFTYKDVYAYAEGGGWTWKLDDVPSYSEVTNMFDQYKLCMIKMHITYSATPAQQLSSTPVYPGNIEMIWAKDYTDAISPTNVNTLMQMEGVQQRTLDVNRPIKITIKPRFSGAVFASAVSTAYSPRRGWLQATDYTVPHYGIKWWFNPGLGGPAEVAGRLTIRTTYYIAAKQVK